MGQRRCRVSRIEEAALLFALRVSVSEKEKSNRARMSRGRPGATRLPALF